jgi:hypothetical protein
MPGSLGVVMVHPFTRAAVITSSLPRLRALLLVLKTEGLMHDTRGLYDLRDVQVKKVGNYWLEITGVSSVQAAGVPEEVRIGAGRWRLLAQRPGSMIIDGSVLRADPHSSRSWLCPTSVLVGFSVIISIVLRAWCLSLLLICRCCCGWFLLLGMRCVGSVRVRATYNPARYASNGCHFLKDKKIAIPLRRRFRFWLLWVLSVFASRLGQRTRPVVDQRRSRSW